MLGKNVSEFSVLTQREFVSFLSSFISLCLRKILFEQIVYNVQLGQLLILDEVQRILWSIADATFIYPHFCTNLLWNFCRWIIFDDDHNSNHLRLLLMVFLMLFLCFAPEIETFINIFVVKNFIVFYFIVPKYENSNFCGYPD